MSRRLSWVAVGVALVILIVNATVYTVSEGHLAVLTSFGRIVDSHVTAGLHVKVPFADAVHTFDGRLRNLHVEPPPFLTRGGKQVTIDAYVKWRIINARRYLTTVGGRRRAADERLEQITTSALRSAFGQQTLQQATTGNRDRLVTASVDREAHHYGLAVVDVRIQRIGLGTRVLDGIYERMEASQIRRAAAVAAEGAAAGERIRARANQQRALILAHAYTKAQAIRGAGDAAAAMIDARAYRAHPHFFVFYRSLRAYVQSFGGPRTVLILGPDSGFLRYLPMGAR